MPTPSTSALGRLARKLVNERRIVQISGKMLIASSSSIVGAMKSQAIARSERPRMRRCKGAGVASAARTARRSAAPIALEAVFVIHAIADTSGRRAWGGRPIPVSGLLHLAVFLEHLLPVGEQAVEGLLGRSLVGDDEVVDA